MQRKNMLSIIATPLGGDPVLLSPKNGEDLSVILEVEESFARWFKDVRSWNPLRIAKERFVWLIITGIPLHA